jgi:cytochrome c biogenesis protein CcdA
MRYIYKIFTMAVMFVMLCSTAFAASSDKVVVDYYYGVNCHFCQDLKPWLDDFEKKHKDTVVVNRLEVQMNKENAQQFSKRFLLHFTKNDTMGTPTVEIEKTKMLVGEDTIKKQLEAEVQAAMKAKASNTEYAPEQKEIDKKAQAANAAPSIKMDDQQAPSYGDSAKALSGAPSKARTHAKGSLGTPELNAIAVAALADSVNPCAILVLIILLSSIVVYNKGGKKKAIAITFSFISAVYITYFLIGLGITHFLAFAALGKPILYAVGGISIFVGLVNLKDAVLPKMKCGFSLEIPQTWRTRLMEVIRKATSPAGAFASGILVTMFELPCTGGPYLFGTTLIASAATISERVGLLLFYNAIFVLPLVLIAFVIIAGVLSVEKAEQLRDASAKYMHAVIGILMFGLGLWVLLQ